MNLNTMRELFSIEGWKKYSLALIALLVGGLGLGLGKLTGSEYVALIAAITALFGASDVGVKWVNSKKSDLTTEVKVDET